MRKNKKEPKSYTMLILTIFLGIVVLGGGSILVLSYTGIITSDTEDTMFMPKTEEDFPGQHVSLTVGNQTETGTRQEQGGRITQDNHYKITLNESIGLEDKVEGKK